MYLRKKKTFLILSEVTNWHCSFKINFNVSLKNESFPDNEAKKKKNISSRAI